MRDEFDTTVPPGRRLPMVGVLLGMAVLAAAAIILPRFFPPLPRSTLVAGGAAAGLILWLLALAGGLRRGPIWWTAASLALLVGAGALAGFNASRIGHADTAADASTFAELELDSTGAPVLPSNPARGPISTAYADLVRADARAVREHAEAVAKLNVGVLNSPYALTQSPALLKNCSALGALETRAAQASAQREARTRALADQLASANLSETVKQGIAAIVAPPTGTQQALLAQERELWGATRELCALLAKRSWTNANGYFGFASSADRAAFATLNQRRVTVETERKRIQGEIKAAFEAGREKVRAALS